MVAALLLLKALATGGARTGAVLLQPRLKLLVVWFILQGACAVSASKPVQHVLRMKQKLWMEGGFEQGGVTAAFEAALPTR